MFNIYVKLEIRELRDFVDFSKLMLTVTAMMSSINFNNISRNSLVFPVKMIILQFKIDKNTISFLLVLTRPQV